MSKFDKLLERIDPKNTLDYLENQVDEALNTFPSSISLPESVEQVESLFCKFHRHLFTTIANIDGRVEYSTRFDGQYSEQYLQKAYGRSWRKVVYDVLRTGSEGGLLGVLRAFAREMTHDLANRIINSTVHEYLNGLSSQERVHDAPDEYLRKFGHLLPPLYTEANGAILRCHFAEVLGQHPHVIRRMRSSIRR